MQQELEELLDDAGNIILIERNSEHSVHGHAMINGRDLNVRIGELGLSEDGNIDISLRVEGRDEPEHVQIGGV